MFQGVLCGIIITNRHKKCKKNLNIAIHTPNADFSGIDNFFCSI